MVQTTLAYSRNILVCGICDTTIWHCDGCKVKFYGGQPIVCYANEHFCEVCGLSEDEEEELEEEGVWF